MKAHDVASEKGRKAFREGLSKSDCPYIKPKAKAFRKQWFLGYLYEKYLTSNQTAYIECDNCGEEKMTLDVSNRKSNYRTAYVCSACGFTVDNIQDPK